MLDATPEPGAFVRRRPAGSVHIVAQVDQTGAGALIVMACGKSGWGLDLDPADGDHGRQCAKCWDAM